MGKFETFLDAAERIGFRTANITHKIAVSGLAIGSLYGFYTIVRDYRSYFKLRRDPDYSQYLTRRDQAIRDLMRKQAKSNAN